MSRKHSDPFEGVFFNEHLAWTLDDETPDSDEYHLFASRVELQNDGIYAIKPATRVSLGKSLSRLSLEFRVIDISKMEEEAVVNVIRQAGPLSCHPGTTQTQYDGDSIQDPIKIDVFDVQWAPMRGLGKRFFANIKSGEKVSVEDLKGSSVVWGSDLRSGSLFFETSIRINEEVAENLRFFMLSRDAWVSFEYSGLSHYIPDLHLRLRAGDSVSYQHRCSVVRSFTAEWIESNQQRVHEWFRMITHGDDRFGERVRLILSALSILRSFSGIDESFRSIFASMLRYSITPIMMRRPEVFLSLVGLPEQTLHEDISLIGDSSIAHARHPSRLGV